MAAQQPSPVDSNVYAPPRAEPPDRGVLRHSRWGIASLALSIFSVGLFVIGFAVVVAVEVLSDGAFESDESAWFDAWLALVTVADLVAAVCGVVGCLQFSARRWTAALGLVLSLGLVGLFVLVTVLTR